MKRFFLLLTVFLASLGFLASLPAHAEETIYFVQPGETLSEIATRFGINVATIVAANNIANPDFIVSRKLVIPDHITTYTLPTVAATAVPNATPGATPVAPASTVTNAAPTTSNLFPNPSFEGDWYFAGFSELQIPNGWQVYTEEGANSLSSAGDFLRPEIRVVPSSDLPSNEQSQFIFGGNKTIKAFKGGAPTNFAIFTDISLAPGRYRMTIRFFPDTVVQYNGSEKVYAGDPLAAEMRIVHNTSTPNWQPVQSGQRNTVTYEFTVTQTGIVRLGAGFRNRFVAANNGWFLDDWSLVKIN